MAMNPKNSHLIAGKSSQENENHHNDDTYVPELMTVAAEVISSWVISFGASA